MAAPALRDARDAVREAAEQADDAEATAELHEQADAIANLAEPVGSETHNVDRIEQRREDLHRVHESVTGEARERIADAMETLREVRERQSA